jgi:hypothetical protein
MEVSQAIETNVRAAFSVQDASEVLVALAGMQEPPHSPEWAATRVRVQIAVLMLARGNIELLRKAIKQSQADWRDTLMAAGLGNSKWLAIANCFMSIIKDAREP